MKENKKGLHITLTEEQKRLWDFMLAQEQIKLGKSLTTQDFLLILMEGHKSSNVK